MKAVLSKEVGGPEKLVIEDVAMPEAGKNQVLIEVKACGVNFPDVLIIQDMYQFKPPRPFSPGGEIAGVVKAVGEGVTHVKAGDRVLASCGNGGMAEYVVASAHGHSGRHAVRGSRRFPDDLWHQLLRPEGPGRPQKG